MDKYIILGHENPDVDSIVSGYLLEKLMKKKGYDVEFVIPDEKIDSKSVMICQEYGINACDYQKKLLDKEEYKYILVDHHERTVTGTIVGVIDHHPSSLEVVVPFYLNEAASSTSCLICRENEEYFSKEDIELALIAAVVDTASFHSTKTRLSDVSWALEMAKKYQLDYEKIFRTGLCLTDISDIEVACFHGLKKYNFYELKVESSYIQIENNDKTGKAIALMIEHLKKYVMETHLEEFVFLVHDMVNFKTTVYDITSEGIKVWGYDKYTSRGDMIILEIEKKLRNKK